MRYRRHWASALIGGAALAAVLLIVVPAAMSSPGPNEYTATITPNSVAASSPGTHTFAVKITNTGSSGNLGSVEISVPGSFQSVSFGTVATSGPQAWTASQNGNTIDLRATTEPTDLLAPNGWVSVDVTADAPTTTGSYPWGTE